MVAGVVAGRVVAEAAATGFAWVAAQKAVEVAWASLTTGASVAPSHRRHCCSTAQPETKGMGEGEGEGEDLHKHQEAPGATTHMPCRAL